MRQALCIVSIFALAQPGIALGNEPEEDSLHRLIDRKIAAEQQSVTGECTDGDFVRRIHLDLTGVIPTAQVAREFLESNDENKRQRLVDQLLDSDAYARHMATVFDVMLMERRPDKHVTTIEWRDYLAQSFSENKPLNVLCSEVLGADGVDEKQRPAAKFYLDRAVDKDALVKDIGRLMLGVNLQCAQCHDHPDINDYLHKHYHGLSVFVAGSKTFRQPDGKFVLQETAMREVEFASVFDPETTNKTGPRLIDALMDVPEFAEGEEYVEKPSRTVRSVPKFSLRELLAERLPSRKTPEFARNMANRLWAMMMGRGLVHPLDMHHSENLPSHPELLEALANHLAETNFDVKQFLREIALTGAYQRSSLLPDGVDAESVPVASYAVANLKGLSPEQLFESLLVATQSQAILEYQIDEALAEAAAEAPDSEPADESEQALARRAKRAEHVAQFVAVYGSVPGQPEGEFSASLPQALFLANSETISDWIPPGHSNLAERLLARSDPGAIADELYLSALSRFPVDEEREIVTETLKGVGESDRESALAVMIWSLLASAEFRLNH